MFVNKNECVSSTVLVKYYYITMFGHGYKMTHYIISKLLNLANDQY